MNVYTVLFYVIGGIAVISALFAAFSHNLVRSVFALFMTFFCIAGLYVYAHADFLAITQLVVYAGGILILVLFGVMLSNRSFLTLSGRDPGYKLLSWKTLTAFFAGVTLLVFLCDLYGSNYFGHLSWMQPAIKPEMLSAEHIGVKLMTRFLLPFEIISIVLLIALAGSVYLARRAKNTDAHE